MIVLSRGRRLADDEIVLTAIRAQGNGGQHVNKTSSAIHLRFDIQASSLSERDKQLLLATRHHLISEEGVVIIKAQEYRNQLLNRDAAIARLVALIESATVEEKRRKATRPTRASRERRLAGKAQKSQTKALRGKVRE